MKTTITPADLYAMSPSMRMYWRRKLAGVCVKCGKAPPENGRPVCRACREKRLEYERRADPDRAKRRAWAKARADRLRAGGRCVDCCRSAQPGRSRCEACLRRMREWMRRRYRTQAAEPAERSET